MEPADPGLLHPVTGEVLETTVENAAALLNDLRNFRYLLFSAIQDAQAVLLAESTRQGTKTLHIGKLTATVSGGPETEWDTTELVTRLIAAGCPGDRLRELVKETVSYRVDRNVARQLAAANPGYAKALEETKSEVDRPYRVSVK